MEFVVEPRNRQGIVHSASKWCVSVLRGEETDSRELISGLHRNTHDLSSKNRQMVFATISSFLCRRGPLDDFVVIVLSALLSTLVAPRHRAKSMVDDCQSWSTKFAHSPMQLTFCLLNSSSMILDGTFQCSILFIRSVVVDELCGTRVD